MPKHHGRLRVARQQGTSITILSPAIAAAKIVPAVPYQIMLDIDLRARSRFDRFGHHAYGMVMLGSWRKDCRQVAASERDLGFGKVSRTARRTSAFVVT